MDWKEVTIYTTTAGVEPVAALLEDNGVEGYVLEDAADFEEFLQDTEIYWDYVDEDLVREKRAQETCLKIGHSMDSRSAREANGTWKPFLKGSGFQSSGETTCGCRFSMGIDGSRSDSTVGRSSFPCGSKERTGPIWIQTSTCS